MKGSCFKGWFCLKEGFMLIELLVVVLIIGILAAVAVPQYQKAVEKSRLAEALMNIDTVMKNVDLYVLEHGEEDSEGWTDPNNWTTDLSGGTWSEDQLFYNTKNFWYYIELGTHVVVYRCAGACSGDYGMDTDTSAYTLQVEYRLPSNSSPSKICEGYNSLGKYICKSLTSQGWADWSE